MKQFHWVLLRAAVRHSQRLEVVGNRKVAVVYYLKCTQAQFIKEGRYTFAMDCRWLLRAIEQRGEVNAVYQELKREFAENPVANVETVIPSSNTGITPSQAAILEEFVNGHN